MKSKCVLIVVLWDEGRTWQAVADASRFLCSWVILLAIGVIVSGKLLAQNLQFRAGRQLFRIPIKGILTIEATGAEVVLGLAFYLICLLLLGAVFGSALPQWVKVHFGIDPGQFSALGFMSSLSSVAISLSVFLFSKLPISLAANGLRIRRDHILNEITKKATGQEPETLPEVKDNER